MKTNDWCGLKDDPELVQCCCNCKNHLPVYYHCTTEPKPTEEQKKAIGHVGCDCSVQKGWACCLTMDGETRIHDNWPLHSIGCECYDPKTTTKPHTLERIE